MTTATHRARVRTPISPRTELRLLDAFDVVCGGESVGLPLAAQRLTAFLALHERPVLRSYVAGALWPETPEERAHANLRSTLWRLHRCHRSLVDVRGQQLR